MKELETYNLYIDECGDHYLATYDHNFPIFTLCGILVPMKQLNSLKSAIDDLKQEFWQTTDVITTFQRYKEMREALSDIV